jgi:hypothetical protein
MGIVAPIAAATTAMGAMRAMRALGDMGDMVAMGAWVMTTEVEATWRARGATGGPTETWRHPLIACQSDSQQSVRDGLKW